MTSEQGPDPREVAMIRPADLDEVKEAVCQVRASSPKSVLVDLVEEKIRKIEGRSPTSRLWASSVQERPLFG
jgi:hypothetical protein